MKMTQFLNTLVFTGCRTNSWISRAVDSEFGVAFFPMASNAEGDFAPLIRFFEKVIESELSDYVKSNGCYHLSDYLTELITAIKHELTVSASFLRGKPKVQYAITGLIEVLTPFAQRIDRHDLEFDVDGFLLFQRELSDPEAFYESLMDTTN